MKRRTRKEGALNLLLNYNIAKATAAMKRSIIIMVVIFPACFARAQSPYIDSIRYELAIAKEDSNKVKLYNRLAGVYFFNQPDSAIFFGKQALELAQEVKFKSGEAAAYNSLWVPFFAKGEYTSALDYAYRQLHLYEEMGNEKGIAASQMSFANIYREQGNPGRALEHVFTWKKIYEKLHLVSGNDAINIDGNLALIYEQADQLDSALIHAQSALDTAKRLKRENDNYMMVMRTVIGDVYRKRKDYALALKFYQKALPVFIQNKTTKDEITTNNAIGECYLGIGKVDSALLFTRNAYQLWQPGNFLKGSQQTAELMAKIYRAKGINDSAVQYLELSMSLKDSLYSQAKERAIQNLAFEEQQRQQQLLEERSKYKRQLWSYGTVAGFMVVLVFAIVLWRNNRQKQKANSLLRQQNEKIENTLSELKATQTQLIQSEKMASLGELTAGIAHEIQNPLNFVNNFSEVNDELLKELNAEADKGNLEEVKAIAKDIAFNSEKINHHGKRADSIVKGMLQHSRTSTGQKEATDVNALADEYLRLAYHGLRAKDKSFNATTKTVFDDSIGNIKVNRQDIGRVILNLISNAFYVVNEKAKQGNAGYEPTVIVSTAKQDGKIEIKVKDNGNGIPQKILDKIFQPFFTTKPTGQGTGLGLSMAYE